MVSKAKADLLNGTLKTPKEAFTGETMEGDIEIPIGSPEKEEIETFNLLGSLKDEDDEYEDEEDDEDEDEEDEDQEIDMSSFMKTFSSGQSKETEEKEEPKKEPSKKVSSSNSKSRRRGRPRIEETPEPEVPKKKPEEPKRPSVSGLSIDVLIKALAINLVETLREDEDIEINGLNAEQLQPVWEFIKQKINE